SPFGTRPGGLSQQRPGAGAPPAPALPWEAASPASAPQSLPQSVPPAGAPAEPDSPFPPRPGSGPVGGPGQPPFPAPAAAPSRSARREVEDEWDEEEDEGPQYTWLHYIILVVVAFVLGLLVWKLVLEGDSSVTDGQAAAWLNTLPGLASATVPGGLV
ncbi:hypothetical protein HLB15_10715, partial [Promicromonospora citrea]|nr:hypothetical protein [Promicromonospora citrea]